jgi:hypothetical protein
MCVTLYRGGRANLSIRQCNSTAWLARRRRPSTRFRCEPRRRLDRRHEDDDRRQVTRADHGPRVEWLGLHAFAERKPWAHPGNDLWERCRLRDHPVASVPVAVVPFELALGAMMLRTPAGFDEHDVLTLARSCNRSCSG